MYTQLWFIVLDYLALKNDYILTREIKQNAFNTFNTFNTFNAQAIMVCSV